MAGKLIMEYDKVYTFEELFQKEKLDRHLEKEHRKMEKYCEREYKAGINYDLDYDKLSNDQPIQLFLVGKEESKWRDCADPNKIVHLIDQSLLGETSSDSCNIELACRTKDYKKICNYLDIKQEQNSKEDYYDYLMNSLVITFGESDIEPKRYNRFDFISLKADGTLHKTVKYILANLHYYQNHFINARDWEANKPFWAEELYLQAKKDMKHRKHS